MSKNHLFLMDYFCLINSKDVVIIKNDFSGGLYMKIDVMDQLLIDINNIRNIEYINFWDLHGTSDSKILVIPALMINYDGGKTINLCAKDKYFDTFVRKVVEVYNDEKDNILEDSLTDPFRLRQSIKIDERTKRILSSGLLEEINTIYSYYEGKDNYDSSLLFQIDEVKNLLPIIKHHIKYIFGMTDINISFNEEISGYRNYYTLGGKVDGIERSFILSFDKKDSNNYDISIQGLLSNGVPFNMSICFSNDSLTVGTCMGDKMVESTSMYLVTNEVVKEVHNVKKNGIPIAYCNRDIPSTLNDVSNITDIDSDTMLRWFRLPWGAIIGIDNNIVDVSDTEKIIERHNMYVDVLDNSFILREYFSKSYHRNKTVRVEAIDVTLDEVRKNVFGVCIDSINGIYAIESSFSDKVAKSGYYDEHLAGNYFYHIVKSDNGVLGISREGLVSVGRKDNILNGVDLLNKANVYRVVKGE